MSTAVCWTAEVACPAIPIIAVRVFGQVAASIKAHLDAVADIFVRRTVDVGLAGEGRVRAVSVVVADEPVVRVLVDALPVCAADAESRWYRILGVMRVGGVFTERGTGGVGRRRGADVLGSGDRGAISLRRRRHVDWGSVLAAGGVCGTVIGSSDHFPAFRDGDVAAHEREEEDAQKHRAKHGGVPFW